MKVHLMAVIAMFTVMQIATAASLYFAGYPETVAAQRHNAKRSMPADPEWNQLGWAWGKRSGGVNEQPQLLSSIPRRLVRALHPVKKNPDWQDLGFAWGRRK